MSSGRVLRLDVLNGAAPPPPVQFPASVSAPGRGAGGRGRRAGRAVRAGRGGRGGAPGAGDPLLHQFPQLGQPARVDVEQEGQVPRSRPLLKRGLTPSRGGGSSNSSSTPTETSTGHNTAVLIGNLTKLVTDLKSQVERQGVEIQETVQKKIEEEQAKLQHKVATQINSNLDKFDQTKVEEKYKYKASGSAISRIVEVRTKIRVAIAEGERDFEDFLDTKTGEALKEVLQILDRQEGLIRLAESNKYGYKLVDKLKEDNTGYSYINDPELIKKVKAAEKILEREDEASKKRNRERSRSRSRSRYDYRSPKQKKSSSPPRRGGSFGFECYWCHKPGHS